MARKHLTIGKYLAIILGLVCSLALAGTARAEGSWSSYVSYAAMSFNSRNWTDNHIDSASTNVTFSNCRDQVPESNSDSAGVTLFRVFSFWPDENRGTATLPCYYSATGYYGEQPSGTFHWTITDISQCGGCSWQRINADVYTEY